MVRDPAGGEVFGIREEDIVGSSSLWSPVLAAPPLCAGCQRWHSLTAGGIAMSARACPSQPKASLSLPHQLSLAP